jgi:hypothetical protein
MARRKMRIGAGTNNLARLIFLTFSFRQEAAWRSVGPAAVPGVTNALNIKLA